MATIYSGKSVSILAGIVLTAFSVTSFAEDYYRWVGADGVTHYGSSPPQGVEAVKVKTYGGAGAGEDSPEASFTGAAADEPAADEANLPPEEVERRRKVAEKQKEVCEAEKKRLEVLNRPGRIRMKQPDGTARYMTQDEIQQEIATTNQVMADACK
ncbi:protein of unknown function [Alteromonadaceae bacterium Bs31]|nr:protein of unknown function [Alteromonadaceae bacterium Bs31]